MENFKRLFPTEFYAKFIENNIRPDGRTLRKSRKISVGAGTMRLQGWG
jgi:exosome complex component RRP43